MNSVSRSGRLPVLSVALLAFLGGCAGLSPDAGFKDVETLTASRIAQHPQWRHGAEDDRAAAELSQQLLSQPLDANAAVQLALVNNRGLQAVYNELGVAQGELASTARLANPMLSGRRWSRGESFKSEIGIEFDFLSLLLLPARLRMMRANFEETKLRVGDEILRVAAETRAQYYRALAADQNARLAQAIASSTEAAAELAAAQRQAGNLDLRQQARYEAMYAEMRSLQILARQQAANERERLNRLMGLAAGSGWTLPEQLPAVPAAPPRLEGMDTAALDQRLDVQAAEHRLRVIAENLGITETARFTRSVLLGWGVLNENGTPRRFGPSLAFELPLFDQGSGRIALENARLRQNAEQFADLAATVRAQVREKANDLLAAHAQVEQIQKVLLPLRRKIFAQTQRFYNGMLESVYDLLESYRDVVRAEQAAIAAVRDYWIAEAELQRAVGGRFPAPAAPTDPERMNTPERAPAAEVPATAGSHSH